MARKTYTIEEKIELQKQVVSKAKDKYDNAVEELEKLMTKRNEIKNKELLEAITKSDKSFDEIMDFLTETLQES
jgi:formiminotetrahydrofolate cyclodeaminase